MITRVDLEKRIMILLHCGVQKCLRVIKFFFSLSLKYIFPKCLKSTDIFLN